MKKKSNPANFQKISQTNSFLDEMRNKSQNFSIWGTLGNGSQIDALKLPSRAPRMRCLPSPLPGRLTLRKTYFPGQAWFQELRAMASEMVVVPFRQQWVQRPPGPRAYGRVGPNSWNATFFRIPTSRASVGDSNSSSGSS